MAVKCRKGCLTVETFDAGVNTHLYVLAKYYYTDFSGTNAHTFASRPSSTVTISVHVDERGGCYSAHSESCETTTNVFANQGIFLLLMKTVCELRAWYNPIESSKEQRLEELNT